MSKAFFKLYGRFDGSNEATVIVDRSANLFQVRPKYRHRTYELRLEDVAQIVLERVIKAEVAAKRAARKKNRQ